MTLVAQLWRMQIEIFECCVGYGLGWQIDTEGQINLPKGGGGGFGHGGAMGSELWIQPQYDVMTVLLVHMDRGVEADGGRLRREAKEAGITYQTRLRHA